MQRFLIRIVTNYVYLKSRMGIPKFFPLMLITFGTIVVTQRTAIDEYITPLRILRGSVLQELGRTGEDPKNLRLAKQLGKLQAVVPDNIPFPCSLHNTRSHTPPTSVHALRPGDIDITAAIGDGLAAGLGLAATKAVHALIENRGISYSSGGQANWRQFVTVPNILKEFNPNLIGYATGDSYTFQPESQFSVAEGVAMSRDMPYMSNVLINRLKLDKRINIAKHWKVIHMLIGGNDFCIDACYYKNPEKVVENHRKDLLAVLRTFKEHLPRTFVNIILSPNLQVLTDITLRNRPNRCYFTLNTVCPCLFGLQFASLRERLFNIMKAWQDIDVEVTNSPEFDNDNFTVVLQPFTRDYTIPRYSNGLTDYSSLSEDCFHLSQKEGARAAISIWNNMLEPVGKKSTTPWNLFDFKCPTDNHPYIYTRRNSN